MNIEITLPVAELKQALPGLSKVVSRKTTLPVLQTVKVSRQSNGQVIIQATDLDSFVAYNFTDKNKQPVELLVPFEQLSKAVKSCGSKDEMAIICEGKETKLRYYIAGSPVCQPVNVIPVDEWPPVPKVNGEDHKLEPEFGVSLRQALECSSDDSTRYAIQGACLDVTDKKAHYIVGTDGRCLFSANSFSFGLSKSVIIPDTKFLAGSGLLDDTTCFLKVGKDGKYVQLHTQKWTFITKAIEANFPNWRQVIPAPDSKWTRIKLGQPAVDQLLQVIPKLPGEDCLNHTVRLRIEEKCIWAEGRNKDDKDWTKIAIPDVQVDGKPQCICLNRNYLLQALKFGLEECAIQDELSPLVFTKAGKRFVVMPVRPDSSAPKPVPPPQSADKPVPPSTTTPTERKTMPRVAKTAPTAPQSPASNNGSAIKELLGQVDQIKESVKTVLGELTTVAGKLKAAEKEKRVSEKEVEVIRKQLRRIQTVTI